MHIEMLTDDSLGRWVTGEVGEVLENDFPEKYDYFVKLTGTLPINWNGEEVQSPRIYYFYKHEVKPYDYSLPA